MPALGAGWLKVGPEGDGMAGEGSDGGVGSEAMWAEEEWPGAGVLEQEVVWDWVRSRQGIVTGSDGRHRGRAQQ